MNSYHADASSSNEDWLISKIKETSEECILNLLNKTKDFCESINLNPAEKSFKQGWKEAMEGKTMPIDELWVDIEYGR